MAQKTEKASVQGGSFSEKDYQELQKAYDDLYGRLEEARRSSDKRIEQLEAEAKTAVDELNNVAQILNGLGVCPPDTNPTPTDSAHFAASCIAQLREKVTNQNAIITSMQDDAMHLERQLAVGERKKRRFKRQRNAFRGQLMALLRLLDKAK